MLSRTGQKLDDLNNGESTSRWLCCQLGARDHYSVPRGLHRLGLLEGLITEAWISPTSVLATLPGSLGAKLRARYDDALSDANVLHSTIWTVGYEARASIRKSQNLWDPIIARNNWFQAKAVRQLRSVIRSGGQTSVPIVFAYSYAAREILRAARDLGCTTVLGQIDPGPVEEQIVAEVCRQRGATMASQRIPDSYWDTWREECDLSHSIVVNSAWARDALIKEGIAAGKIHVVPLAYDRPEKVTHTISSRKYPSAFDNSRPLRVLFLGSLIPRKGIYEMLDAAALMKTAPVEFQFVGTLGVEWRVQPADSSNLNSIGPVERSRVHDFYRNADVFILPTHSDGFGLTQLEAMASGLPVIASTNCGEVVQHGVNGLILPTVSAEAIAGSLEWILGNAQRLVPMSENAALTSSEFNTHRMISRLLRCAESRCESPELRQVAGEA
jgi:glycosyltransferase involved in cell wall biosynthesis